MDNDTYQQLIGNAETRIKILEDQRKELRKQVSALGKEIRFERHTLNLRRERLRWQLPPQQQQQQ